MDTAVKTAETGYMQRRLVKVQNNEKQINNKEVWFENRGKRVGLCIKCVGAQALCRVPGK